jgi:alpha-galactosidase
MRTQWLILLFVCMQPSLGWTNDTIQRSDNPQVWTIETENSTYQTALANDGNLIPVYFGAEGHYTATRWIRTTVNPKQGSHFREIPYRGGFVNQTPAIEVLFHDQTRDTELLFDHDEIKTVEGYPTLLLHLADKEYGLTAIQYIRVIPELDIYEKWMELTNTSTHPIQVENAQSGSLMLPENEYTLTHLSGRWGNECMVQKAAITPGVKTLQSRNFRVFDNPPWFAVSITGETSDTEGNVWFGGLEWEGNFRLDFEKFITGQVQVIGGINFWDTAWTLRPTETFTTPKMIYGFSNAGMEGASQRLHAYVRTHLLREAFRDKIRPVLYNSWYATTFQVEEQQQLELADIAKEIGVELFVIDDGWFKGRKNDKAGLGDWTVDTDKFPNGLNPMIDKITAKGLDFGIWVEPEMVNPDSDLYRAHPDWAFHYPKRTRHEGRNQLMLNLAREDVYQYLLDSLSALLENHNIRFIKWDYNRDLSEPGWPGESPEKQREVRIRYFYNFQRLVKELERRFPEVWFECCSGGGGRISYGPISYFDQFWASDNTNPSDRLLIQDGFLHGFPPNMMVSWVTHEDWHKNNPSMKFRFYVSMCGVLGVGDQLPKWSPEQSKEAAVYIQQYKDIRHLVQQGIVHRLLSPFEQQKAALQYRNEEGSESALLLFNLYETLPGSTYTSKVSANLKLRGLDASAMYEISGDVQKRVLSGNDLMNIGIPWPISGNFQCALVHCTKVKK